MAAQLELDPRWDQAIDMIIAAIPKTVIAERLQITALLTGMRRGEILNLRKSAIDFASGLIRLTETKTNKARYVPVHASLVPVLRRAVDRSPSEYVFTSDQRRRTSAHPPRRGPVQAHRLEARHPRSASTISVTTSRRSSAAKARGST